MKHAHDLVINASLTVTSMGFYHLVNLLPSLQILSTDVSVVMEQCLCDAGVGVHGDAVVQRGQVLAVSVVGRSSQFQHCPHSLNVVCPHCSVHRRASILGSKVQDCSSIDQRHHHPRWSASYSRYQR